MIVLMSMFPLRRATAPVAWARRRQARASTAVPSAGSSPLPLPLASPTQHAAASAAVIGSTMDPQAAANKRRSVLFVGFLWPEPGSSAAGVRTMSLVGSCATSSSAKSTQGSISAGCTRTLPKSHCYCLFTSAVVARRQRAGVGWCLAHSPIGAWDAGVGLARGVLGVRRAQRLHRVPQGERWHVEGYMLTLTVGKVHASLCCIL
jgi:hypothetical protein